MANASRCLADELFSLVAGTRPDAPVLGRALLSLRLSRDLDCLAWPRRGCCLCAPPAYLAGPVDGFAARDCAVRRKRCANTRCTGSRPPHVSFAEPHVAELLAPDRPLLGSGCSL